MGIAVGRAGLLVTGALIGASLTLYVVDRPPRSEPGVCGDSRLEAQLEALALAPDRPAGCGDAPPDTSAPFDVGVAREALRKASEQAASCRPRGGPTGSGRVRVEYCGDGEVRSVELLDERFRGTLTGACVRMVFRRATIPAFVGRSHGFAKRFSIPDD